MKEHPRFGICFDYAHAHVFGDENHIEEWVKTLAPYIRHVHINDNHCKTDEHLAIGDGNIDWRRFLLYREKYFPEATILLEVKGMDKIKKSMEYLKSLTNIKSITVKAKLTALDELRTQGYSMRTEKMNSLSGSMVVRNVPDEVMEVFEMTGFSDILDFA